MISFPGRSFRFALVLICALVPILGEGRYPMPNESRTFWSEETLAFFDKSYDTAINVSIVRLLADPKIYSGKVVRLWGVYHVERETMALFLNLESYEYGISQNAIPITTTYTSPEDLPKLNGHYVWIIGVFDARDEHPIGFPDATGNGHLHDVLPIRPAQVKLKVREAGMDAPH